MKCVARWSALVLFAALAACGGSGNSTPAAPEAASGTLIESQVTTLPKEELAALTSKEYLLYLPPDYNASEDKKWPLIVFLHGSSPSAQEQKTMAMLRNDGLMYAITQSGVRPAAIVVAPLSKEGWGFRREAVDAAIRDVQARYKVDPNRVSLTGMSLGAINTWNMSLSWPYRFSAVAAVAGGLQGEVMNRHIYEDRFWGQAFKALAATPFRVFHGSRDTAVPIEYAEHVAGLLIAAGGNVELRRTDTDHIGTAGVAFTQTLADWLVSQQRSGASSEHPTIDGPERYTGRFYSLGIDQTGKPVDGWVEFSQDTASTLKETGDGWGVAPFTFVHLGDSRFMGPFGDVIWFGAPDPQTTQMQCQYYLDAPIFGIGSYDIYGARRLPSGGPC
ncbi:alpha/beta hydrolase-fold protein [Niveibacterium sp.]|uniref:carboxylesterase family protein n=1 Tax=Niveibacterium sp. TaxID=2017444 RepID=UPI0035B1CA1D